MFVAARVYQITLDAEHKKSVAATESRLLSKGHMVASLIRTLDDRSTILWYYERETKTC